MARGAERICGRVGCFVAGRRRRRLATRGPDQLLPTAVSGNPHRSSAVSSSPCLCDTTPTTRRRRGATRRGRLRPWWWV